MKVELITTSDLLEVNGKLDIIISKLSDKNTFPTSEWFRSSEVCKVLNCSPSTLKNMRDRKAFPWKKVGGTYFYDLSLFKKTSNEIEE